MVRVRIKTGKVRNYMARKPMSQRQLANKMRITEGYLSQLLAGDRYPSPRTRRALLRVLKGGFDDWLEMVGEQAPDQPEVGSCD